MEVICIDDSWRENEDSTDFPSKWRVKKDETYNVTGEGICVCKDGTEITAFEIEEDPDKDMRGWNKNRFDIIPEVDFLTLMEESENLVTAIERGITLEDYCLRYFQ